MKPMFLPGVEANSAPGPYATAIAASERAGAEYPLIWRLFAFKPEATVHLANFTQEIMHGEAPLTSGQRELIAAFVSSRNECPF